VTWGKEKKTLAAKKPKEKRRSELAKKTEKDHPERGKVSPCFHRREKGKSGLERGIKKAAEGKKSQQT